MTLRAGRRLTAILSLLVVAAACGPSAAPTPVPSRYAPLAGTLWKLGSINGAVPPSGPAVTIAFDLATVSGIGPCNSYSGGYVLDPSGSIRITDLISTKRACVEQARGELETVLFGALRSADGASVGEDGRLVLNGAGGRLIWDP